MTKKQQKNMSIIILWTSIIPSSNIGSEGKFFLLPVPWNGKLFNLTVRRVLYTINKERELVVRWHEQDESLIDMQKICLKNVIHTRICSMQTANTIYKLMNKNCSYKNMNKILSIIDTETEKEYISYTLTCSSKATFKNINKFKRFIYQFITNNSKSIYQSYCGQILEQEDAHNAEMYRNTPPDRI